MAAHNPLAARIEAAPQVRRNLDDYAAELNRQFPNTVEAIVTPGSPRSLHLKFRGIVEPTDFDHWIKDLSEGRIDERTLNEAPEKWKAVADCRMLAIRRDDGSYAIRRRPE
jgi:hypothetical protein